MTPILLDTGVIVAWLDRGETRHRECVDAIESIHAPLVTCEPVITEACYLVRHLRGAREEILKTVAFGTFHIPVTLTDCAAAVAKILRKYRDRDVSLADACLVHLATELRTGDILTLDRDFLVYRWAGAHPFRPLIRLAK